MAVSVVMPALEMAQETGKLVSWLKKEGQAVRKGEMLLEVETDKAVVEVEAAGDGILAGITAQPGDVVPVGHTIAWLVQPGETPPAPTTAHVPTGRRTDARPAAPEHAGRNLSEHVDRVAPPSREASADRRSLGGGGAYAAGAAAPGAPARISPKARRLAQEHGVDIGRVTGSGPGGEILADDVLRSAKQVQLQPDTTIADSQLTPDTAAGEARPDSYVVSGFSRTAAADAGSRTGTEPITSIGRLMAERTTQSWTTVPHFFVAREVDAGALNAAREATATSIERSHGVKVTHTDLIAAAVARTLTRHPRLNASWSGGGIVVHREVNIALAMAVDNAVVTAVIPGADTAAIADIAVRRRDLAERARAGRLQPGDIAGATFTISNLGMFEVDAFTAIIVPPQAAILAVGAIVDRVVAVDGKPAVRPMMTLTLSCDHRVVDGARAAEFLRDVVAALREASFS